MDFRGLDLNLLIVLDAMFEECSTTGVARRLGTSQPTASASLAKLRRFFGDELFVRRGAAMEPTPLALTLQSPVRRIIDTVRTDLFSESDFDPAHARRTFTLTTSDVGELVFIPSLLKAASAEAPGVTFQCVTKSPGDLKAMMATGQIELALGYFPDLTGAGFFEQRLFEHPFACLVRRDHPTVADSLTLDQFLALDHIVVEQEGRSQELFERRMAQLDLHRRVILRSPHFISVPVLLAESDAIATVPQAVARIYSDLAHLKVLPLPVDTPPIVLKQFWHRCVHTDPGVVWLRKLVARLFMNRDPSIAGGPTLFATAPGDA